jgi:hypothetical protein
LALLAPDKAASFEVPQSREEGTIAYTSSEGDRMRILRNEEEDA